MTSSRSTRPAVRGLVLAATAVLVALLLSAASASAFEQPRTGHWCGFQTSHELSPEAVAGTHFQWVDQCSYVQHTYLSHTVVERHPVSFYVYHDGNHYYLQHFLFGFDAFRYVDNALFSGAEMSVSQNGRNIKGAFPRPWFFKGTLQHGDGTKRNLYAWWVGRSCPHFSAPSVYGCTS